MELNAQQIESIVRRVLGNLGAATPAASGDIPKTAKVAMLTSPKHIEVKEFPIPETLEDDDILVRVEGCGVCGTDVHEWKGDPFGLIPVVLGHEGTGEIVKIGKNVKKDSAGKPLGVGDKVVTCMIFKDNPDITMFDLNKQNVGGADVYGLLPDDDIHLNGWFSDYILVRGGSTVFNVSDLDLDSRILIEPCAVLIHAVERAKTTGILKFNSRVVVQGCGPIGLMQIAVLKAAGVVNIIAVDGDEKRLAMAKKLGAAYTVNFMKEDAIAKVMEISGTGAEMAFQCTGSPKAASTIWKYVRRGGSMCELGFFVDNGDTTYNPHQDICNKEIRVIGSWTYQAKDWLQACDVLKEAQKDGLPVEELLTHKYALADINEAMEMNISMQGLKIVVKGE